MTDTNIRKTGPNSWCITLIDAGDGSGDAILELPQEIVEHMTLKEGDAVYFQQVNGRAFLIKKIKKVFNNKIRRKKSV